MILPDDEWRGLMIDFETLDTSPTAVILSAGVVVFSRDSVEDKRYWEFDIGEQIANGRTVSRDTQDWWIKTNQEEFIRLLIYGDKELYRFTDYLPRLWEEHKCQTVWSRHHMDIDISENIMDVPWAFYQERDVATLDEFGTMKKNGHNALEDCINQVEFVQSFLPRRS